VCLRLTHQLVSCDKIWLYLLDHMFFGLGVIFLEWIGSMKWQLFRCFCLLFWWLKLVETWSKSSKTKWAKSIAYTLNLAELDHDFLKHLFDTNESIVIWLVNNFVNNFYVLRALKSYQMRWGWPPLNLKYSRSKVMTRNSQSNNPEKEQFFFQYLFEIAESAI